MGAAQRRSVFARARKLDIPESRLRDLVRNVSGQTSLDKLTKNQATELLAVLSLTAPKGTPLAVEFIHSPSRVLALSAHGAKIYEAAEAGFFEQERLVHRFSHNFNKVTRGLTREQKDKIARFRLRIDRAGNRTETPEALDPALAEVNRKLTAQVFEPMFQIGVKKGLVAEDRHIDDYLTYYRDDTYRLNRKGRRDMAAQLAQELGLPLDLAERMLEQANVKKVNFGPFDYQRLAETVPGLRDLDRIAEIYTKGFARKVTVTDFLAVANKARSKIADEGLRRYAKAYIDQYAGKPRFSFADDWLERTAGAIPGLRNLRLSMSEIAGTLTAVQYMAKIGFNLFTPILNLTQTIINTVPKAGAIRTFGVLPKSAATILLPNALNPFVKDLARLRRAGVLDSLMVKFERPHLSGATEAVQKAAEFFFSKSEQINRATAFLAGYKQAKDAGKNEAEALRAGREMVRVTQFFSGRLDAQLFARTPLGRVVTQFKTFTFKEIEFVRHLNGKEKVKFALWSVALGGPASFLILQAFQHWWPDDEITELLEEWQTSWSLAAMVHAKKLSRQVGVFMVPGVEALGQYSGKERLLAWAAGPTISTAIDLVQSGSRAIADPDKAVQFVRAVIRGVTPGGVELLRVIKAMEADPEHAVPILLNFYEEKKGRGRSAELDRLLGGSADAGAVGARERRLAAGSL